MKDKRIILIIILILILVGMLFYFFKSDNSQQYGTFDTTKSRQYKQSQDDEDSSTSSKVTTTTLKSTGEITSATTENLELHATYYLAEICVEENQYVEAGANLVKYTNGEYLVAPYDCCVTELNLPDINGKVLNSHYIKVQSTNILSVQMKVDESIINDIELGTEAEVTVSAVEKTYTGYVTHVSSTAQNGKFTITIEFENDNNAKIGMTGTVSMKI